MRCAVVGTWACLLFVSAVYADEPPPFAFEWVISFPPGQMATDSQGNVWIINTASFVIQRMTRDGHNLYPLPFPSQDICHNASGNMFVMGANSFVVFDDSVSIVQRYFPPTGSGIAANAKGEIFIVSSGSPDLIARYAPDGYLTANRSLAFAPLELAWGANGILYTLDPVDDRVVRFDKSLRYIDAWSGYDARSIATDPDGNLYVLSSDRITKLSPDGTLLAAWGEAGDGPGQFGDAVAMALNDAGDVYVADRSTRRVLMFGTRLPTDDPPPPPPPPPPGPIPCPSAPLTQHPALMLLHLSPPLTDCECRGPGAITSVVTSADPSPDGSTHTFVYLIASPGGPGLFGFEAAVGYRPHRADRPGLEVISWHACAQVELPEPDWPDSGAGNTFTWGGCNYTDVAVGGYFEVIAHDASLMRVLPLSHASQVKWSQCPSRDFDDVVASDRLGWVSWGSGAIGPDQDGCNPALGPCQGITDSRTTTWGRMKTLFQTP